MRFVPAVSGRRGSPHSGSCSAGSPPPGGCSAAIFSLPRRHFVATRRRAMTAVRTCATNSRANKSERHRRTDGDDHAETSRNLRIGRGGGPRVPPARTGAGAELAEPAGQDHRPVRRRRRRRHARPHHRRPSLHRVSPAVLRGEPRRRRRHGRRAGRRRGRARRLHPRHLQHRLERDLAGVQRQCRLRRAARFHPHRLSGRAAGGDDRAPFAGRDDLQGFRRARAAEKGAAELHFAGDGLARVPGRRNTWRGRRTTRSATFPTKARAQRSPTWWPGT